MIDTLFDPKKLRPKFFASESGDLFIRITVKNESLTKPVPSMKTIEEAREYIDKLVPEMAKELYRRRRNRLKRKRKE